MREQNSPERYEVKSILSEGLLFRTWLGIDLDTGKLVVIKRALENAKVASADLDQVLRTSFEFTRYWKHPGIVAPLAGYQRADNFEVVHRFIPDEDRLPLTPELLLANSEEIVVQLFTAVEFIHLMGCVHCDLKPENIFVQRLNGRVRVLVSDLDLVRPIGVKPNGKIIGTQPFIAPEIIENDIVIAQSDCYSIGAMLFLLSQPNQSRGEHLRTAVSGGTLHQLGRSDFNFAVELQWLEPIAFALLQKHYQIRPASLVRLLNESGREDLFAQIGGNRKLFWDDLRSGYNKFARENKKQRVSPVKFIRGHARIFGLPDEISQSIEENVGANPRQQAKIYRHLFGHAALSLNSGRWTLALSADGVNSALNLAFGTSTSNPDRNELESSARDLIRRGLSAKRSGRPITAICLLTQALTAREARVDPSLRAAIEVRIALLLHHAGFRDAGRQRIEGLIGCPSLTPRQRIIVLNTAVDAFRLSPEKKRVWGAILRIYGAARSLKSEYWRSLAIEKMILTLWYDGQTQRAHRIARKFRSIAERALPDRSKMSANNTVGAIELSLGKVDEAERSFRRALEFGRRYPGSAEFGSRTNLITTLFGMGRYREALNEANLLRQSKLFKQEPRRTYGVIHGVISASCITGEYAAAERASNQFLALAQMRGDVGTFAYQAVALGWLQLRSGKLTEAGLSLQAAATLTVESAGAHPVGLAQLYLALLSAWRGSIEIAIKLNNRAAEMLSACNDKIALLDGRQISFQIDRESGRKIPLDEAEIVIREYLECSNPLGAAFTASLLLLEGEYELVDAIIKKSQHLSAFIHDSGAVIGKAVLLHLKAWKIMAKSDDGTGMTAMREALMYYRKIGYFYHAANVARTIAEEYQRLEKQYLARGFWREATRLYTVIGNQPRVAACLEQLDRLNDGSSSKMSTHLPLLEISQLVNSIEDYSVITRKLLAFAVEQTGAERAALLLATEGGTDLRIESALDCDKVSLADILDMSKSVVKSVFERSESMIITDALTNEITRQYRSVIEHNIYSIACVPLLSGGELVGVLYLDHHSLPNVFSVEERRLVEAVANFIGVALSLARQFDMAKRQTRELVVRNSEKGFGDAFITRNESLSKLVARVPQVADSRASILLRGESGTGKEVLASIIHQNSPFRDGPLVALNCAALDGELGDSVLFGIEKGIATGVSRREGKLQMADGGSLFLDEIGDMPLLTQAKLLRVLETREVEMIGSHRGKNVEFRLIAATNRDLLSLIEKGQFRRDLYYRINTIDIALPPMRERMEDLDPLIQHFASIFCPGRKLKFTRTAWKLMNNYQWPGNVRELRNLVERLAIQSSWEIIDENLLSPEIRKNAIAKTKTSIRERTEQSEKVLILEALTECAWNQSAAARKLGLPFTTLQRKIQKHKIKIPRKHR